MKIATALTDMDAAGIYTDFGLLRWTRPARLYRIEIKLGKFGTSIGKNTR